MNKTTKTNLKFWTALIVLSLWFGAIPHAALAQSSAPEAENADQMLYLPVLADDACSAMRDTSSVFGIQKYGDTSRDQLNFPYLQGTAAHWLRVTLYRVEVPTVSADPLIYNFRRADSIFMAASEACVNIIATLEWQPYWNVSFDETPYGAAQHAEFAQFMKALVERYDGDGVDDNPHGIIVHDFEIYNEPDYELRWGNKGADYAALLKAVYPAAKEASSEANVIFGGVAYDGFTDKKGRFVRSFVEDVLAAGGGAYFDIMNFHYYPSFRGDWTTNKSSGLAEKTAALRALLAKYKYNKEFIVTETSWPSNTLDNQPSSEDQQSRFLVQLFTQALAYDIDVMIWWLLQDSVTNGLLDPRQSGLITAIDPIGPKKAYFVFRTAGTWLGNAAFLGTASQVSDSNDLEAYHFRNKTTGKTFYVAWRNPIADDTTQPFQIVASKATVYNKDGNAISNLTDAGDGSSDGKITVQVGGSPVYILID